MSFAIIDLPAAMRREGFINGAALMDRWFFGVARTMPQAEKEGRIDPAKLPAWMLDEQTVTMKWLLRFKRAADAHNTLLSEWSQGQRRMFSLDELTVKLRAWRNRRPLSAGARFGDLSLPAKVLDRSCQINIQRVTSGIFDPIDDLYAALGNATLKIAASAILEPIDGSRVRITVDEVATYVRDTYDFNGDQPLGSWGQSGFSRAAIFAARIPIDHGDAEDNWSTRGRYYQVDNRSFRDYRARFNKGGDFSLFSDVQRHKLRVPVVHEVAL